MSTTTENTLREVEKLTSVLPPYARLIALNGTHLQLAACNQVSGPPNERVLQEIYRTAISKVLHEYFGMSAEEASSDEEFIDFYVRHGIVTNKLMVSLFRLFAEAGGDAPNTMDDQIQLGIKALQLQE